jgi:hypothetical protein
MRSDDCRAYLHPIGWAAVPDTKAVMPALGAGIHDLQRLQSEEKSWMAGTRVFPRSALKDRIRKHPNSRPSPAMT